MIAARSRIVIIESGQHLIEPTVQLVRFRLCGQLLFYGIESLIHVGEEFGKLWFKFRFVHVYY